MNKENISKFENHKIYDNLKDINNRYISLYYNVSEYAEDDICNNLFIDESMNLLTKMHIKLKNSNIDEVKDLIVWYIYGIIQNFKISSSLNADEENIINYILNYWIYFNKSNTVHIPADTGTVFPVILGHRWQS
jgi:hypothetical protein